MPVLFAIFFSSLLTTLALSNSLAEAADDAPAPKNLLAALPLDGAKLRRIPSGDLRKLIKQRNDSRVVMNPDHINNFMAHTVEREAKSSQKQEWTITNDNLHYWLIETQGYPYNPQTGTYSRPVPPRLIYVPPQIDRDRY